MNPLEKEIEKIRYELAVTIPEELHSATFSDDILESSEYSEILSRQYLLNVRLVQLNKRLYRNSTLDLSTIPRECVGVGSVVQLQCNRTASVRTIKVISGEMSDNPDIYEEVTPNSPTGKALYNKKINDEVVIHTPSGIKYYKIVSLQTIHELNESLDI